MKIKLYTIICRNVKYSVQKPVVELESRYIALSMNRDLKYSNGLYATREFQRNFRTCEGRIEVEWETGSFPNE
jgi:hypothetical protein